MAKYYYKQDNGDFIEYDESEIKGDPLPGLVLKGAVLLVIITVLVAIFQ